MKENCLKKNVYYIAWKDLRANDFHWFALLLYPSLPPKQKAPSRPTSPVLYQPRRGPSRISKASKEVPAEDTQRACLDLALILWPYIDLLWRILIYLQIMLYALWRFIYCGCILYMSPYVPM